MGTGTGDKVNVVQQGHTVVYRKDNILKLGVAASGRYVPVHITSTFSPPMWFHVPHGGFFGYIVGSKGRLGQLFFSLDQVIGHPYGSVFEIQKNGKLVLASHRPDVMVTGMWVERAMDVSVAGFFCIVCMIRDSSVMLDSGKVFSSRSEVDGVPTGDNREINDGSRAQKLDHEQITQLKQEGIGGEVKISVHRGSVF